MNSLDSKIVLRVNSAYMRIGWTSPKEALIAMTSEGADGSPAALALDIHYSYDEYGMPITDKMEYFDALDWEFWLTTEPRKGDLDKVIHTARRIIRIPTVIVCPKFHKMPMKYPRPTPNNIYSRDGNKCQYSGAVLTNKTRSLDHIVPKSKGGKDTFLNLVTCHKDINSKKGNKYNHEAGLKLLRQPVEPKSTPLCNLVTGTHHVDHSFF